MNLSLIVAMSENGVIGRDGRLPWHLSADLRRFKRLTMGHHIVMGRKTFESIGRLLPGRTSVIISRRADYEHPGVKVASGLSEALRSVPASEPVFVVGGGQIYELALPVADSLYVTVVHGQFDGDTYFRFDPDDWRLVEETWYSADQRNSHDHTYRVYRRTEVVESSAADVSAAIDSVSSPP